MKKIFASLLFAVALVSANAQPTQVQAPLSAAEIIKSAQSESARSNRNVFVLFDASW